MTKTRPVIGSLFAIALTLALFGCHPKDPDVGPTNPTPPPANMQAGKSGTVLQGGMPQQAAPGGAQPGTTGK